MYGIITHILQPYTLFCLCLGVGVVLLWRKRRELRARFWLVAVPSLGILLMSFPWVSFLITASLEWQFERLAERPANTQAIVVLSGEIRWPDSRRQEARLGLDTTARCVEAARLYHQGRPCPVVVSGGKPNPESTGPSAAQVMRDFLLKMGVKPTDIILEDTSRSTHENAVECRMILNQRQIDKIVLVTDASHMYRAAGCFRKEG